MKVPARELNHFYTRESVECGMISYMVRHIPFDLPMGEQIAFIQKGIPAAVTDYFGANPGVIEEAREGIPADNLEGLYNALEGPLLSFCQAKGLPLMEERIHGYLG